MHRRSFLSLTVALAATAAAVAAFPGFAQQPRNPEAARFIGDLAQRAITSLADARVSDSERAQRFRTLLANNFDVPVIGRFVLGRYYRNATEAQRAEFQQLLASYLTQAYANRFKEYSGNQLRVDSTRAGPDNEVMVASTVMRPQSAPIQIEWRLEQSGGSFKILDVWIEGVSMAVTQRDEFAAIIQRGGNKVEALLASLRRRAGDGVAQIQR